MKLPRLSDLEITNKRVLLRLDLDVPTRFTGGKLVVTDDSRLKAAIPTIMYILGKNPEKINILGHIGRPGGEIKPEFSLIPVGDHLEKLLGKEMFGKKFKELNIFVEENLRFDEGEEKNDLEFAKKLASLGDVYVNEAFGVCHRSSASVVGVPKLLPHAAGLNLEHEVEMLSRVLDNPERPVVAVIGGGKLDKALIVDKILNNADYVLVGGLLPAQVKSYCREDAKICVSAAHLTDEKKDITPDSARNFSEIISRAKTIIWNGPMGDIDSGFWDGTEIVAKAIASSGAYKVAGGGDTLGMLTKLNIADKIDYVSTGGGAFLEFLAYGDLPGLKALRD